MTRTSPFVIVAGCAAGVAVVYAFVCEVRQDRLAGRLKQWVAETYPEEFGRLPWFQRRILTPRMALGLWVRQRRITDDALVCQYAPIARLERQKLIALAISVVFFVVLCTGAALWGWRW